MTAPSPTLLIEIQNAVNAGRIFWKKHTLERLLERGIRRIQVKNAILHGKVIEYYPDDYPVPSVLLASLQPEPLHVVVAYDEMSRHSHVITAYRPDLTHFNDDLITRRLS
jgi:Domain of unknown function (DUF4258)